MKHKTNTLKYEDMPSNWRWILDDAYEAQGEYVHFGYERDDADFATLTEMGLLKKVMVQSGLHPKFGYKITREGIKIVLGKPNETQDEINRLRDKVSELEFRIQRYNDIIYASRDTVPNKRSFLERIDLAKYDLRERYPEDYVNYQAYSDQLTNDILWYGYKWSHEVQP